MATNKKAASKEAAKPKKVYFSITGKEEGAKPVKYELLGGPNKNYIFKGERFTKEEAGKNAELCASLVATGSPVIEKV